MNVWPHLCVKIQNYTFRAYNILASISLVPVVVESTLLAEHVIGDSLITFCLSLAVFFFSGTFLFFTINLHKLL